MIIWYIIYIYILYTVYKVCRSCWTTPLPKSFIIFVHLFSLPRLIPDEHCTALGTIVFLTEEQIKVLDSYEGVIFGSLFHVSPWSLWGKEVLGTQKNTPGTCLLVWGVPFVYQQRQFEAEVFSDLTSGKCNTWVMKSMWSNVVDLQVYLGMRPGQIQQNIKTIPKSGVGASTRRVGLPQ